jgi:hypothetical protein
VGTRSGGRPPRVAGAPGVVIIEQIQFHHAINGLSFSKNKSSRQTIYACAQCSGSACGAVQMTPQDNAPIRVIVGRKMKRTHACE